MEMRIAVLGSQSMEQESLLKSFMKDITLFEPNIRFQQIAENETTSGTLNSIHYDMLIEGGRSVKVTFTEYPKSFLAPSADALSYETEKDLLFLSEAWMILIDGQFFSGKTREETVKALKKNISKRLIPLITEYAERHNEVMPKFVFVLSDAGKYLLPYMNSEGKAYIAEIIEAAFGGIIPDLSNTLIMMNDSTVRSCWIAVLALFYKQLLSVQGDISKQANVQSTSVQNKIDILQNKLAIESTKRFKSKSVIANLESQLQQLRSEKSSIAQTAAKEDKKTEIRNTGLALNCLLKRHEAMLVSGFQSVRMAYDTSTESVYHEHYWKDRFRKINVAVLSIIILVMVGSMFVHPPEDTQTSIGGLIGGVFWAVIGLCVDNGIAKVLGAMGALGGFMMAFGKLGVICVIAFFIWMWISNALSDKFEMGRIRRLNIQPTVQYKDPLAGFYEQAVRKG